MLFKKLKRNAFVLKHRFRPCFFVCHTHIFLLLLLLLYSFFGVNSNNNQIRESRATFWYACKNHTPWIGICVSHDSGSNKKNRTKNVAVSRYLKEGKSVSFATSCQQTSCISRPIFQYQQQQQHHQISPYIRC